MTSSVRSTDYVGSEPTWNADDLLVLNDDDVADLVRAAINAREVKLRSRSAMALAHRSQCVFERQKKLKCLSCKSPWALQGVGCRVSRAQLTTLHVQSQKQQSRRRYAANGFAFVPQDPCRCPPVPSCGIRQGCRTGNGVGVHLRPPRLRRRLI